MSKSGTGMGSASIVLIFAVLCMTIFAVITYASAKADVTMVGAETRLVMEYYAADTLAESILAEILDSDVPPESINGVKIEYSTDFDLGADIAEYACVISDRKELYVKAAMYAGYYDILSWSMRDTGKWVNDDALPVWQGGDENSGVGLPVWDGG